MPRTAAIWYPEPSHALRDADEDQVVRWIGEWLMDVGPEGWRRLDLTVRLTSMVEEIVLVAAMPEGGAREVAPPPDVSPLLLELRQKKYTRGRGTWLSLRMTVALFDRLKQTEGRPVTYERRFRNEVTTRFE